LVLHLHLWQWEVPGHSKLLTSSMRIVHGGSQLVAYFATHVRPCSLTLPRGEAIFLYATGLPVAEPCMGLGLTTLIRGQREAVATRLGLPSQARRTNSFFSTFS
jgi:hypothetical protein